MKNIAALFACLLFAGVTFAQGTLQFNQVKVVTTTQTVPTGKVWKVESAFGNALVSNCSTNPLHTITVNGNDVTVTQSTSLTFNNYCYGWQGVATCTQLPFWLPAGASLAASTNVTGISVIEFNVVP